MILGIVLRYGYRPEDGHWADKASIPFDFWKMAEQNDITLCAILNPTDAARVCDICDGLIVPGSGNPVLPEYYGGDPTDEEIRFDEYGHDKQVIDLFVQAGKPIFGICQGIQVLNIYFGGTIKRVSVNYSHGLPGMDEKRMHHINIEKDSFVYDVFGTERAEVNSHHGRGIDKLGEGLRVVATADDGVIEAVENREKKVFAVQWHPEQNFHVGDPIEQEFFKNFIEVCKQK